MQLTILNYTAMWKTPSIVYLLAVKSLSPRIQSVKRLLTHVSISHIFPHVIECHSVILSQFYSHFHNIIVSNTLQIFVSVELRRMTMIRYKGQVTRRAK